MTTNYLITKIKKMVKKHTDPENSDEDYERYDSDFENLQKIAQGSA